MPDIYHNFIIKAPIADVFAGIATPKGLDTWWTLNSTGSPVMETEYLLDFGPQYQWKAVVTKSIAGKEFELKMTGADPDWMGTRVGFLLEQKANHTQVCFHHTHWQEESEHYKISSYCWAMYLRILKRNLEFGELVPYEKRLDV